MTYFNMQHRRSVKAAHLRCTTPGCGGRPRGPGLSEARALLEYQLRENPTAVLQLHCERCGATSTYDYPSVLTLTPPEMRPIALPDGAIWAVLLFPMPTADQPDLLTFFGERLLVQNATRGTKSWVGALVSESQFAPSLHPDQRLTGPVVGPWCVCQAWTDDGRIHPIPFRPLQHDLDFAAFVQLKSDPDRLMCANVPCANPSCAHYFGLTYSQFVNALTGAKDKSLDSTNYVICNCDICHTARVVDERTYEGLFRL